MAKKTIGIAAAIIIILAVAGLYFSGFFSSYGFGFPVQKGFGEAISQGFLPQQKGFFELGFSSNQLAMLGSSVGITEQEKMAAIKQNFFVFEFGDEQKKQVASKEEMQVKPGSFTTEQGVLLEGWLLRIPNIENGKNYSFEIRIPDYEVSTGQFSAAEALP